MLTFQGLYQRVQDIISDSSTETTTLAKSLINEAYKKLVREGNIEDEGETAILTKQGQKRYRLPASYIKMRELRLIESLTSGTTTSDTANKLVDSSASFGNDVINKIVFNKTDNRFTRITAVDSSTELSVEEDIFDGSEDYVIADGQAYLPVYVDDSKRFDWLKSPSGNQESDAIRFYHVENRNVELYQTPSTDDYVLVINYTSRVNDLANDDYTTGTVSATQGSTTITGSGTTFSSDMIGRYIQITPTGLWYKIKSFASATSLIIESPFEEADQSGASYTIGELPLIDEMFHDGLVSYALWKLYLRREEITLAREHESNFNTILGLIAQDSSSETEGITFELEGKPYNRFVTHYCDNPDLITR